MYRYHKDYLEEEGVYRIYFTDGSMTLSKRKLGELLDITLEQIQETGYKLRNPYKIVDDYVEVYCLSKEGEVVSVEMDYETWYKYREHYFSCSQTSRYPMLYIKGRRKLLHRFVMGLGNVKFDNNTVVDHIDKNIRNSRKSNLRIVSQSINTRNQGFFNEGNQSTGVRGVSHTSKSHAYKYRARIHDFDGKVETEYFNSLKEAVRYNYERRKELGYLFWEGSTTIENYIENISE